MHDTAAKDPVPLQFHPNVATEGANLCDYAVRSLRTSMADLRGDADVSSESSDATRLTDLPESVAALVLARLRDPVDVVSALCSCRLFWALKLSVPFQLCLRLDRAVTWRPSIIAWLRRHLVSTRELDLTGCPIVDKDVAQLVADLPCLDCLVLDNCQKLTSSVSEVLVFQGCGLRTVSLQRCYRLGAVAAGNLLAAASSNGSRLQALFFSHLDGLRFPPAFSSVDAKKWGCNSGAGLQVLALHNCSNIGAVELDTVAAVCPSLKFLMLGGSIAGLDHTKSEDALSMVVDKIKGLLVLEVTFLSAAATNAVRSNVRQGVRIWNFSEGKSVAEAAAFLKCCLGGVSLPGRGLSAIGDNSQGATLPACRGNPSAEHGARCAADVLVGGSPGSEQTPAVSHLVLALHAGANCSDARRRTSLHLAAASGDDHMIANLICIGASASGKRDSSGGTPLFYAAEYGHAGACALLLKSGGELFAHAQNRSGESPFYIAALMGHRRVVEAMVAHCTEHHVKWEDPSLYCDGWTPLMAAAVADHKEVGKILLGAIRARSPLLDAQNRYGLTALHIAARKPSAWFVENLLTAGARPNIEDNNGNKPFDLACHFGHVSVLKLFPECGEPGNPSLPHGSPQSVEAHTRVSRNRRGHHQRRAEKVCDVSSST